MQPTAGPQRFRDQARIAVEARTLVVADRDGTEHRFDLDAADAPRLLSRHPTDLVRSTMGEAWTVLDAHRMAFFSTEADVWSADEFSRLADAAGLVVGDAVDRPRGTRPDAVDLSTIAAPGWKVGLAVVVPVIALVILIAVLKAVL